MARRARLVALPLLAVLALAGCSDDSGDDNGSDDKVTSINVTVEGGNVDPNGAQISVPVDEPIALVISADKPGELHVHTDEGIEIEFDKGQTITSITLDRPGVFEVELHEPEKIVMELEAS